MNAETKAQTRAVTDSTLPVETPRAMVVPLNPPRLKARLEHWKIEPPDFAATFDRVFVALLEDAPDTTAGGLHLAAQTKAKLSSQKGLVMSAGPKAVEQLYSHGIAIGDLVVCARFSPYERTYMAKGVMFNMMVIRASEVLGSVDLKKAYDEGDLWLEMAPDGEVAICDREGGARHRSDPDDSVEGI